MQWQRGIYDGGGWNAIFWCNHDQPRVVSRFGDDTSEEMRIQSAKMLAIALHMLQGTPYIYQGEEIGMTDPHFTSIAQYRDVESINAYHQLLSEGHAEADVLAIFRTEVTRQFENAYAMGDDVNAGFTAGKPWIDIQKIIIRSTLDKRFRIKILFSIRIKN